MECPFILDMLFNFIYMIRSGNYDQTKVRMFPYFYARSVKIMNVLLFISDTGKAGCRLGTDILTIP